MHRNCFFFFLCFDHLKGKTRCFNRGLELGPVEKKRKKKRIESVSAIQNGSPYYANQINHSANIVSLRGPMTASPVRYFH